jgi:predicted RND superfamily exporter protein
VVHRFAHWITARPWWSVGLTLLLGVFFISHLPRISTRADQSDFNNPHDVDIIRHNEIKDLYRRNEFFVILIQDKSLFSPARLRDIAAITESVEALPEVKEVVSLANANDMVGTDDTFTVEKFLHDLPTTPEEGERLRRRAVENPLYQRRLLSPDGTTAAIGVFLPNDADGYLRRRVIDGVERVLAPYRARGDRFQLVGWPITSVRLIEFMNQDVARFLPLTLLLALATIWFVFRNARLLLLAGIGVGLTVSSTLGLAAFLGVALNNASVATIPLVMALALSDIVHLFSHLDQSVLREFPERRSALNHVLEQILFPCFLTSVNTAIGFLSFTTNKLPAIQSFGWLAAAGMMFEFLFTFGLVTPLLLAFKPEKIYRDSTAHQAQEIPRFVRWVHRTVSRRPIGIFALCLVALAWGGWQSRKVQVETDLMQYFRADTQVRQDGEFMKQTLGGFQTLMVEFESTRDAFKDPKRLEVLERLESSLADLPGVDQVTSLADYLKEMNKAFHAEDPAFRRLPESQRLLEQYLLLYSADDLDEVVTPGFDRTRIILRLHESSSRKNQMTLDAVRALTSRVPLENTRTSVVGEAVDVINTSHIMVNDQLWNIAQSVGCIWLVMLVVLRSFGMATLFLIPNLFPIVLNFGIMGTFGIPIDTGTALIAAAAFGIIVDDTVHFFTRFVERRNQGWSFSKALEDVTHEKGEAALSSCFILAMGFGVLTLGHFIPVVNFGLLNLVVLATGMLGDMFFLKSMMVLGERWTTRRT